MRKIIFTLTVVFALFLSGCGSPAAQEAEPAPDGHSSRDAVRPSDEPAGIEAQNSEFPQAEAAEAEAPATDSQETEAPESALAAPASVPQVPMTAGEAGAFITSSGNCETVTDIARGGTAWKFSGRGNAWVASLDVTDYVLSGGNFEFSAWVYVDAADATVVNLSLETKNADGTASYSTFGDYNGEPRKGGEWVPLGGRIRFAAGTGERYTVYLETGHYQEGNKYFRHMPDIWVDDVSFIRLENEYDLTLTSLKSAYDGKFLMGNIMAPEEIGDTKTAEMFKYHYNVLTAGNAMKPASLSRAKDEYNFTEADKLSAWAAENGLTLHGHVLVWHQQSPAWLNGGADAPLTRAEAKANLEAYIGEVAGHFAGKVISWDVVNEAVADSAGTGAYWKDALRKDGGIGDVGGSGGSPWWAAYDNGADKDAGESGADYIYDAFVFARLADTNAVLYYNDYNETTAGKRAAIVEMTNELNALWKLDERNAEPERLLIEGLGMQGHYFTNHPNDNAAEVEKTVVAFASTGAEVSVSELDLPIGSYRNITPNITDANRERQAQIYSEIFDVLSRHSDKVARVTFWGKNDGNSWDGRGAGEPLLFDVNYGKKLAFDAVAE